MTEPVSFVTARTPSGFTVLGKVDTDGKVVPVIYVNWTQAEKKAQALASGGVPASAILSPISNRFLVKLSTTGE